MKKNNDFPSPLKPQISGPILLLKKDWNFTIANLSKLLLISLLILFPNFIRQILYFFPSFILWQYSNWVAIGLIVLSIITGILGTIALITFIWENNPKMTIKESFKNTKLFFHYLWVTILFLILNVIGLIIFFIPGVIIGVVINSVEIGSAIFLIPGIIISIYLSFSFYILVCENIKGWQAIKKSFLLVKNYWWAVFGRIVTLILIILLLSLVFYFTVLIHSSLYPVILIIITLFITPFSTVYLYQIYQNLKQIKGT